MNVRFLLLLPADLVQAAMAMQLIDRIRKSFDDVWLGVIIPRALVWLSEGFVKPDQIFTFDKTPGEVKRELLDSFPDYLIDLSGTGKYWLFKNRLRVIDFKLSYKSEKKIQEAVTLEDRFEIFSFEMGVLLSPFDIASSTRQRWIHPEMDGFLARILPRSFGDGYAILFLSDCDEGEELKNSMVTFLTMLDYPVVLMGDEADRDFGDTLTNQVGCTTFNVSGDFSLEEQRIICSGSRLVIGSKKEHAAWAFLVARNFLNLSEIKTIEGSIVPDAERIRKQLKNQNG